ncbi:sensor histidine kinase [Roseateles sp.]|uniref:sensor histidine kinase n=1 Tax=Roseateles sp. TaxID=1971397 RepID=UPI003BAA29EF
MTATDTQAPRLSLRTRLVRHVTLPLLITWALGTAMALGIASYFTQRAYDRAMLDDAYLLATHVVQRNGQLALNMSSDDIHTVLFDQTEQVYFAILDRGGRLVAGHPGLHAPEPDGGGDWRYVNLHYQGQDLRAVVLDRSASPVQVIVALTTHSRHELLQQLALFSVAPQVPLLMGLVLWLRRVVSRDLQPLSRLQQLVESRDAADLSPLPAGLMAQAASRDVHGLATSIDDLLGRVARGVAAQREFAGNVAHELRTPLAGIRALAEYGLSQRDPQQWRDQLQAVLHSQRRASRLVNQLLAIALAEEAGAAVQLKPTDLADLAREQLLQMLPEADRAGVELEAIGLETPAWVMADTALLEGLLGNLLDNALRYGRPPGEPGRVWIELRRTAGRTLLSVCDQGPGMGPERRQALKARWRQGADGAALGVGAGLGLSIVQRYAEVMQADLELAEGDGGVGLRASVSFRSSDGPTLAAP